MKASESKLWMRVLSASCRSKLILEDGVLGHLHLLASKADLFSVLNSAEHGFALDSLLEVFEIDSVNFISIHCFFQEFFHFFNFLLMLFSLILIWVFLFVD